MSLKAFHLFFVTLCTIFLISLGLWSLNVYRRNGSTDALIMGAVGIAAAVILLIYGRWFIRKIQKVAAYD